jgi:hypothetical protein
MWILLHLRLSEGFWKELQMELEQEIPYLQWDMIQLPPQSITVLGQWDLYRMHLRRLEVEFGESIEELLLEMNISQLLIFIGMKWKWMESSP